MKKTTRGFTIVELLIVIVVIAILAAISVVAYNGIQQRARDAQRENDIRTIVKALELYYIDNGMYPSSSCSSGCSINTAWSTSVDPGWQSLINQLVPKYISSLPSDPVNTPASVLSTNLNYNYAYYAGSYCGAGTRKMFLLVYKFETTTQRNDFIGDCTVNPLGPYSPSNYRVVKGT